MNTPAHAVLNLVVLGRKEDTWPEQAAILIGSVLPDAPMFVFYFVEKIVRKTNEGQIWSVRYYETAWQNFFDLFNSLPLIATVCLAGALLRARSLMLLGLSMILHVAGDLPLHHDDGHRHFFPFSDWRFSSPVSYWDPAHYGTTVGWIEATLVVFGSLYLVAKHASWLKRGVAFLVLAAYGSYVGYALITWTGVA